MLFLITPARVRELALAPALLLTAILLDGLRVAVVSADAASFSYPFLGFIRALGAVPVIDDNRRRRGKRFLATRFFLDQWQRLRAPRTVLEHCFAFLKRYDGRKDFQGQGLRAVWQDALLVHTAMLAVARIAYRAGRPALMTKRAQVLAFVTN